MSDEPRGALILGVGAVNGFERPPIEDPTALLRAIGDEIRSAVAPTPWCGRWIAGLLISAAVSYASAEFAAATVFAGLACMLLCFTVGHWLIRWLLSPGVAVCGVARTLIDEAIRIRVVLAFIVALLAMVSVLPLLLDPNELLKYRLQLFLTWTLSGSALLLSVMTLFLACGTISRELCHRQIYLTLTKPVSRAEYLLGKWLGIVLLDLVLVAVVGVGVYAFARVIQHQPHRDEADRHAVDKQILVARNEVAAQPPTGLDLAGQIAKELERVRIEVGGGNAMDRESSLRRARQHVVARWHTVAPRDTQRYLFTQLNEAKAFGQWIQLRFKPVSSMTPPDERVRLALWLNGRPYPVNSQGRHQPIVVADNRFHVVDLPVSAVDERGHLTVRIANVNLQDMGATFASSVSFTPGEGLSVLYQTGRFGPNLVRGLVLIWIRLGFLAMLGLTAGAFLSFPIACLLGMLVYATAAANGFLLESMEYYVSFPNPSATWWDRLVWVPQTFFGRLAAGETADAVKILVRLLGNSFVLLIPSFSDYDPVWLIADGRRVPHQMVVGAVVRITLIWTGLCALIGWAIFDRRELARVTV